MSDCYYDSSGCLVCPEQPAQPAVIAHTDKVPVLAWDAGANSIATVDGDLHAVFTMNEHEVGVIIGLKGSRERQTIPSLIEHGVYFQANAAISAFQVLERGTPKTDLQAYISTDVFEIRRVKGNVIYLKNSALLYTSLEKSTGPMVLNACLYASGDAIPGGS